MKFRRWLNQMIAPLGYQVTKAGVQQARPGFNLYQYVGRDGQFDYEAYRRIQVEGNKRKIQQTWALEENIHFLCGYLQTHLATLNFGLCHGTRRGCEQSWFAERLNCRVLGTEISDTAAEFPDTIQWDFHETKPEWIGAVDFIYSNAFDHSYDPEKCLNAWLSCLRPGVLCLLEHTSGHDPAGASPLDPFGADLVQMPYLITTWGKGTYSVREIIPAPAKPEGVEHAVFIVIQKH
jgi:hypothetical protein